jgi:tRNA pseudouridine13 synthase
MKIKQAPDDFRVDELTDVVPAAGPFALYRLDKTGWTTHDALAAVRRLWNVAPNRVSYGGLKDRHARTSQHFTIENGPPRNLSHRGISVTYLGQAAESFTPGHIRANRFEIVIRDLTAAKAEAARSALEEVKHDGLANYFDDQRFGSVAPGGEFIARLMVQQKWQEALRLALTAPYEFDRSDAKRQKAILRKHWGDWVACKRDLPRCHARSLVDYLANHPADFRGAFARLRGELTGLYLSAYQSYLWNRFLARWLADRLPIANRVNVKLKLDAVPFPFRLSTEQLELLKRLSLPLPSARLKADAAIPGTPPDWPALLGEVLAEEKVALPDLQLKGLRRPFFSRGERAIHLQPENLAGAPAEDENHPTRFKFLLGFELPRGSYATLVVKRLTATTGSAS